MAGGNKRRPEVYGWIRVGGLLSLLPLVLVAGPIAGYLAGTYLEKRFGLPFYMTYLLVTIGIIGSVRETIRIIRIAIKTEK